MSNTEQLLSQLRDIQEPPPPVGVSLWLIAANLVVFVFIALLFYRQRQRRRERWRNEALREIDWARQLEPASCLLHLAKLLRKVMRYQGQDISGDRGQWLAQLDQAFNTHWFTQSDGRIFGDALYQTQTPSVANMSVLCSELERQIKSLPVNPVVSSGARKSTSGE